MNGITTLSQQIIKYKNIPKLFVFDLDLTLWECDGTWIDTCSGPPFTFDKNSDQLMPQAKTRSNGKCEIYKDGWIILHALREARNNGADLKLAVASRTEEPKWARELLEVLNIWSWFDYKEIYPSTKTKHFASLKKSSGLEYEEMIFFDDEQRNIDAVGKLGVTCVYTRKGVSIASFLKGLEQHEK
ncbi:magnesium-dependent phosphatase [Acrasis kona]|uniref:Magnesium-dependent phosphatase n=1 Tax=Acrasis kona TaxID=1008807 RepID=A0AAW2YM73_9EUKA